jgi:hypothetical protein
MAAVQLHLNYKTEVNNSKLNEAAELLIHPLRKTPSALAATA